MSFLYSNFEPEAESGRVCGGEGEANTTDRGDDLSSNRSDKYRYIGKQDYGFFTSIENSKQNSFNNLVIQSTNDENSNTKQFMTYYNNPTLHKLDNDTPETDTENQKKYSEIGRVCGAEGGIVLQNVETTTNQSENWSPINHFYIGSLTVIGLFLLFRLIKKN